MNPKSDKLWLAELLADVLQSHVIAAGLSCGATAKAQWVSAYLLIFEKAGVEIIRTETRVSK